MKYFVKDLKVHKPPAPRNCKVTYTGEKLHSGPPLGYEKMTVSDCPGRQATSGTQA